MQLKEGGGGQTGVKDRPRDRKIKGRTGRQAIWEFSGKLSMVQELTETFKTSQLEI